MPVGYMIEASWKDLRYAARMLSKNPGFAAVAVCSLTIGIGATSGVYSIADALLLRPLPVPDADGVVALSPITDQLFAGLNAVSYPDYADFRDQNRTLTGLAAQAYSTFGFAPDRKSMARMKFGMFVSGNFFHLLGVEPAIGRGFRPDEDQVAGREAVTVLNHNLWVSEFGTRNSVIGEKLWLNGIEFTVIGIAPESFTGTDQFVQPALYVPLAMSPRLGSANNLEQRQIRWLTMKGRLKPGVTIARAQADIDAVASVLAKTYPKTDGSIRIKVESQLQYQADFAPPRTAFILMLGLLAVCVLLVACANVAGLLLSRSSARAREIAVRLAIGAGRLPLLRQLLIENLLLAIGGGLGGLGFAYLAVRAFNAIPIPSDIPFRFGMQLDRRVLLFTACASVVSTLLFGLIPALRSMQLDLTTALKGTDAVGSKRARLWGRNVLVMGQVALSLVLLVVSVVLVQGFRENLIRGPGFRIDRLFLMSLNTTLVRYSDAETERFYKRLLEQTRLASGLKSAALASAVPIALGASEMGIVPEGYQLNRGQEAVTIFDNVVSEGYFQTMDVSIVQGRSFLESDTTSATPVGIVNEQFAHHFWPGQQVIGKRFHLQNSTGKLVEIVGVAKTTKYLSISEGPLDFVYLPFAQNRQPQMTLVSESESADPTALAPVLRRVVAGIDRSIPVFDARSMRDIFDNRAEKTPNIISELVASMGLMGLILAVIGLYGLVAYSVSRRSREIGIRMAIGANRPGVMIMILKQGLALGTGGVAVGLVLSYFACRSLTSGIFMDFGGMRVEPFVWVSLVLIVTTVGASYFPAWHASRIDPMRALRDL